MKLLNSTHQHSTHFLILGAFLILILTVLGSILYANLMTGNMTMSLDPNAYYRPSINISEDASFELPKISLIIDSSIYSKTTYASINLDDVLDSNGQYLDPDNRFIAYSFYLKNTGTISINVQYYMRLKEVYQSMDEYVRIMIIVEDEIKGMYQKSDQADEFSNMPIYEQLPTGINFLSNIVIFINEFEELKPGEIKLFRVLIWLEEQDPDLDASRLSGILRAELVFNIDWSRTVSSVQTLSTTNDVENMWLPIHSLCHVTFNILYEAENSD
jgi:hypothetical protein